MAAWIASLPASPAKTSALQAAVLGFVGAGGIGQDLLEAIRKFYYNDVSAILLLIILAVMVIDMLTERLRHHLIGLEQKA